MKIVIQTQYRENYGAHDWDGKGECPQYWKNKGGSTYILEGVTVEEVMSAPGALEKQLADLLNCRNDYHEVIVIGSELHDDCEPNSAFHEDWDYPRVIHRSDGMFFYRQELEVMNSTYLYENAYRSGRLLPGGETSDDAVIGYNKRQVA